MFDRMSMFLGRVLSPLCWCRMKPKRVGKNAVRFDDGTCWPRMSPDGEHDDGVAWRLRYGAATRSDMLVAASVMNAWESLLLAPRARREEVVRALRAVEEARRTP